MGNYRVKEILDEMWTLHCAKDADYAGEDSLSNFNVSEKFGVPPWIGASIRMSDKWSRFVSLMGKQQPDIPQETLDDTLMDLAVYAVIVLALRPKKEQETPIQKLHKTLEVRERNWTHDDDDDPVSLPYTPSARHIQKSIQV